MDRNRILYKLPYGYVINKTQIVKMDTDVSGDVRIVMTGGITIKIRNTTIDNVLSMVEED